MGPAGINRCGELVAMSAVLQINWQYAAASPLNGADEW
jgi:hypothetical protein